MFEFIGSKPAPDANILQLVDQAGFAAGTRYAMDRAGISARYRVTEGFEAAARALRELAQGLTPLPSLILIDMHFVGDMGYSLLELMRFQPTLRELPVVLISGSIRHEDAARAYRLGVAKYIVRPPSLDEFTEALKGLYEPCIRELDPAG